MSDPTATPLGGSRLLGAAVFCAFFFAFFLSSGREPPWNDARPIHEVAESLVFRGEVNVETRWPYDAPPGRDGKWYAAPPIVPSLVHVPGVMAYRGLMELWPQAWAVAKAMTSHLGPAAMGALTCLLFFRLCLHLGIGLGAASLVTLLLGFGTGLWVYARSPFSEITQAACFTAFFLQLLAVGERPGRRAAVWLGIAAGLLVNTKLAFLLALVGAGLFLGWRLRADRKAWATVGLAAAPGLLGGMALVLAYNWARWGSALVTGYDLSRQSVFTERLGVGLWGMFFSPGKSVFLYAPPLVLSAIGLPRLLRRRPEVAAAFLLTAGPVIALHAKMTWWSGDWAWGPRYLVFAVPALMVPGALLIGDWLSSRRRAGIAAVVAVGLLGVLGAGVQLLGNAFYWDHYIRIAQEARSRWLGVPDRRGARPSSRGTSCDPCFEDLSPFIWLPPFQPIEGHLWLLRHVAAGDDWRAAEKDAPWRRYTGLSLEISGSYQRARLDWWYLDFSAQHGAAGRALLAGLGLGWLAALALWWRRVRGARAP